MATKKRKSGKSKRKRQKEQQQFLKKSLPQLISQGDNAFSRANYREAVKCYLAAMKLPESEEKNETVRLKLFQAYCARAEELKGKKMPSEAGTMEKQALVYAPDIIKMDRESMIRFLKLCPLEDAFNAYETYYQLHGKVPDIERMLAEFLMSRHCWELSLALSDDIPLKRDVPPMKKAVKLMDSGSWEEAMTAMKSLPRSSPFAQFRLFCRAMLAFYADNDKDMLKAISMIPKGSILFEITEVLKSSAGTEAELAGLPSAGVIAGDNKPAGGNKPVGGNKPAGGNKYKPAGANSFMRENQSAEKLVRCLWEGPFDIKADLARLTNLAKLNKYTDRMANCIKSIAQQLCPRDEKAAVSFILETLLHIDMPSEESFYKMAEKILGPEVELLKYKRFTIAMGNPFQSAQTYFKYLEHDFPSPEEQSMAKSMIICHFGNVFRRYNQASIQNEPKKIKEAFGITSSEPSTAILQLIAHGIHLDPKSRELYQLAADIPVTNRTGKNIMESILLVMLETWPDNPEPCLKLASLYHSKNAYRKAENILKKAMELAPHDSRVMDQHVISLLIAGDKNAKKKKFHLVWPDLEKAALFKAPRCTLLIAEKRLFYNIIAKKRVDSAAVEKELQPFPLGEQLKLMIMMMQDITEKMGHGKMKLIKKIQNIFNQHLKRIDELKSLDILNLLMPLPEEWSHNFGNRHPMVILTEKKEVLLGKLDDTHLFVLIHNIDHNEVYIDILHELDRRIKQKAKTDNSEKYALRFYRLTLGYISSGSAYYSYNKYSDIIDNINPETEKQLKLAALKLSKKASGEMRTALEQFDFESSFSPFSSPFDFFNPTDDDDDDWFEDDGYWEGDDGYWDEDDDDDDWGDDDWDEDDEDFLNELFAGDALMPAGSGKKKGKGKKEFDAGIDPFSLSQDMLNPMFIKIMSGVIKQMLKTPKGKFLIKLFDEILLEMESVIDMEDLRGKPNHILKKASTRLLKDDHLKTRTELINECYKTQAKSKLSKEAMFVFIH